MRKVQREDILDYVTYSEGRDAYRLEVLAAKRPRRIHVGEYITLLFENFDTMRYQIQEMVLHERLVREADIAHELETYNELLGDTGELGCTMMIEIDNIEGRQERLQRWMGLNEHLYALLEDGRRIKPKWDERQVGEDRLSAVQYLKFDTGGMLPVGFGCSFDDAEVCAEYTLTDGQRDAMRRDLT
jgi:hypothetical protein